MLTQLTRLGNVRGILLTDRTVTPSIYIACGISGAVHHTCALERVPIIAINPKARIFDYADFGILADARFLPGSDFL